MIKKLVLFILFALLLTTKSNAQRRFIYQHELGAEAGISNFQSDFVTKGPMDGKATINGFAVNATHYLHILPIRYGASAIYRHTILKTSLGVNYSTFDNTSYGTGTKPLNDPPRYTYANTPNKILLARLSSRTTTISLDNELQFYYRDIIRFLHKYNRYRNKSKVNPYVSVGLGIHYFSATPSYDQEAIDNQAGWNQTPGANNGGGDPGYPDNYKASYITKTNNVTISGNIALGARYKASPYYDLMAQINLKYYLSDWMDGVNPDISSNLSNDFNSVICVGFIYHMF
ncbi:hypothetical protein QVZ41_03005 [Wenyingzhuangia sp. chi5]|uniref:Outer membrane protein beta-barrel domain-containing protein n=1 Tax=Wenyingzhuangia gilva TaxID=3057677 RepID=A0ABT8VPE5_9FLAO|nr:hypothetical protein [Wenyingzhuangia sp. chi5]MDO3693816.1 hypothetical protein [Wenyingzhuangia sp. chi5]